MRVRVEVTRQSANNPGSLFRVAAEVATKEEALEFLAAFGMKIDPPGRPLEMGEAAN